MTPEAQETQHRLSQVSDTLKAFMDVFEELYVVLELPPEATVGEMLAEIKSMKVTIAKLEATTRC